MTLLFSATSIFKVLILSQNINFIIDLLYTSHGSPIPDDYFLGETNSRHL